MMHSAKPIILEALRLRPSTKTETWTATGLNKKTVLKRVAELHAERAIFILRWKRHPVKGPAMPVYAVGDKPDAPDTTKRLSKHEVYIRFRKRWDKTDKDDQRRSRDRERYWLKKAATKKQNPFSALGL